MVIALQDPQLYFKDFEKSWHGVFSLLAFLMCKGNLSPFSACSFNVWPFLLLF